MVFAMPWSKTRPLIGAILAAILVAATLAVTGSPASAHTKLSPGASCSGTELSPHRDAYGGAISVFISYSSANGGTNCVWAQKNLNRDKSEHMEVFIGKCPTGNSGNACEPLVFDRDSGNFQYYAGPAQVTGTADRCILVYVVYRNLAEERWGPIHCS
ncbi:hypothetical protein OG792_08765 [Micromonospora sp. NBC_01699]|uniref:hypothetical protein n=1 Tax=Micromonospora sp. NBC_01699 TaxID=2975984 RepID=UPI002E3298A6|nr:hypothetical protein [Micromonospora sp. NBC_01699]